MRQTACLVVNPIIVDGYASLFNCTTAVWASGLAGAGGARGGVEGGNGGNCGTGVRASILKLTPIIYLAFEKTDPFIY